mmetsp:Transcript_65462/g.213058  ORF Transcript_65462/g.213058 Transcript_65462/m.213058 type:complete len:287 (+) Transcript_65462:1000-1860(+)
MVRYCSMARDVRKRAIHCEGANFLPKTKRIVNAKSTNCSWESRDTMSGGMYFRDTNLSTTASWKRMLRGVIRRRALGSQQRLKPGRPWKKKANRDPNDTDKRPATNSTDEKAYGKSRGSVGPSSRDFEAAFTMLSFALSSTKITKARCSEKMFLARWSLFHKTAGLEGSFFPREERCFTASSSMILHHLASFPCSRRWSSPWSPGCRSSIASPCGFSSSLPTWELSLGPSSSSTGGSKRPAELSGQKAGDREGHRIRLPLLLPELMPELVRSTSMAAEEKSTKFQE